MQIQHLQTERTGKFFISENSKIVAKMDYRNDSDNNMVIEHTEVDERLREQKIGHQLLDKAIDFARTNKLKIIPQCAFVAGVFNKDETLKDVLK